MNEINRCLVRLALSLALFISCYNSGSPANNNTQNIQPKDLIGTWISTHDSMRVCITPTDTYPYTDSYTYTDSIYQDSIKICLHQTYSAPCGIMPLPYCSPIAKWTIDHDTLFVLPSFPNYTDTTKYALSRVSAVVIIFSSANSIDTFFRL
jgi:hypothetical protein